jgi:hypothetical protein
MPTDATPYPGACWPLEPVEWAPLGSSVGVPTDTTIQIRFDDYPDPDTVGSDSVVMTTGFYWVPAGHHVNLMDKILTIRPWRPLSANVGYTVHLQPTLHSLQGCPTEGTIRSFRTGDGPAGIAPPPAPPPFTDVQALFDRRCGGGCHLDATPGAPEGGCVAGPAAGLSLCARDAFAALVDVPSRAQRALPLVDPGNAARSVLLRKLIPATAGGAPPPPTLGHRDPPGLALERAEIDAVAAWIDGGAMR